MTTTGLTHWSKDCVEHVRAVHFALVLVSFALIVAALNRTNVKLMAARTQIEQIADFEKKWTARTAQSRLYRQALLDNKLLDHWSGPLAIVVPKKLYQKQEVDISTEVSVEGLTSSPKWLVYGKEMSSELLSLSDFITFWNAAHDGFFIFLPKKPTKQSDCSVDFVVTMDQTMGNALSGEMAGNDLLSKFLGAVAPTAFTLARPYYHPYSACTYGVGILPSIVGPQLPLEYELEPNAGMKDTMPRNAILSVRFPLSLSAISFHPPNVKAVTSISDITVEIIPFKVDEQYISKMNFTPERKGDFVTAFPELKDYLGDITLLDISSAVHHIESLPSSNEQNLSILGFTIALSQVSTWGAFVLLAVQLYFWIHLRELVDRIELNAEGWNVAWIGIYETKLAATLASVSGCVLPIVAACVLATQSYMARDKWLLRLSLLVVSASTWVGILTATKLIQLKRASRVALNEDENPQEPSEDSV